MGQPGVRRPAEAVRWRCSTAGRGDFRPLWALPLQTFVYRQLMYLVVLQSVVSAIQGLRLRWHHVERSGDVEIATSPAGSGLD